MDSQDYIPFEMMLLTAAKQVKNGDALFVGFHWPMVASRIARRLHAPDIYCVYEGGGVERTYCPIMPNTGADLILSPHLAMAGETYDTLCGLLAAGHLPLSMIDAPMVDRYGNINSTCIGPYLQPKVRLAGSGGAADLGANSRKLFMLSDRTTKDGFPSRVDYVTTPGYLDGFDSRIRAGYRPDTGPEMIISPLGLFKFDPVSKEAYLWGVYPRTDVEKTKASVGWDLKVAGELTRLDPPKAEEIKVVREELDIAQSRLWRIPGRGV
jgi:glutaconate CoA-transferase subunit B